MMANAYLYLNGEFPRIGSGRRAVEIVRTGWKWVTVAYRPGGPNGHTIHQKIRKEVFDIITTPGGRIPDPFRVTKPRTKTKKKRH